MRSPEVRVRGRADGAWTRARPVALGLAMTLALGLALRSPAQGADPPRPADPANPASLAAAVSGPPALPPRAQVGAIIDGLRRDPDLQETRLTKTLRWKKDGGDGQKKPVADSAWNGVVRWIAGALQWLAEAGRWLVWLLGALAVALLALLLRRWMRERADFAPPARAALPSRVGTLDVRPESLPEHIGVEARALWLSGAHRAALSLLYRGALSRLIHVHAVPIRAANTEDECLRLARASLEQERSAYFARLVGTWRLAVYAARDPDGSGVLGLCDDFDRVLGDAAPGALA